MAGEFPVIDLHRTGRRFGPRWAVRDITLQVQPGETAGIVGADGAGKTTLLQMCAAILDPTEGTARVLGFDTVRQSKAVTSRIGYMSQGFTLYDRLSVEENLHFSAQLRGVPPDAYTERRGRLLEMAGLATFHGRPAGQLSGGMRKKLALCTNLIHEPRVLILDEPGLGVDPLSRRQLWEMLEVFRQQGVTILVATSYMEEAERCDRILMLQDGRTLAVDQPARIREMAAGNVYEIPARDPARLARDLQARTNLFGLQLLPDRVRFQRAAAAEGPADRPLEEPFTRARAVSPTLEDVFVLRAARSEAGSPPGMPDVRLPSTGSVEAESVTVAFGDFVAVDAVSLRADPGTLLALLGPNGAGKTTLIRAFCGLVPVASGSARVAGLGVAAGPRAVRERIGYMSQRFSLYRDLTLGENLSFFASAYGMARRQARDAVHWASTVTGLASVDVDTPVAALSGATRQRLALACSILHQPSVLFLDEPTSGVDPLSRYRFWQLIRSLSGAGMVVVVTTHYLNEAEYCDRIGLMHRGRLIALGTLPELRAGTGTPAGASVEEVFVSAIRRAGLDAP